MDVMIEARGLSRRFGPIVAVDDVSFAVGRGEVLGFLGPNGAGKSTTMKMITGFLAPTSGTASVCGADIVADPIEAKRHIGYLPEGAPAYPDMTPPRLPALHRRDPRLRRRRGEEAHRPRGRTHWRSETCWSSRSRRCPRASSAASAWPRRCCTIPPVLILDEPTDGLDPNQKHEVRALITRWRRTRRSCSRPISWKRSTRSAPAPSSSPRGQIVADGTPAFAGFALALPQRGAAVARGCRARRGAVAATPARRRLGRGDGRRAKAPRCWCSRARAGRSWPRSPTWCAPPAGRCRTLRVERGRLDDVFRSITGG